ncbi:MAG: UDP-N-acetylmuramoyl-L-alanyl-D-glutamate--2,6-diaminopimelate ligase [Eubacteriales bacterium]
MKQLETLIQSLEYHLLQGELSVEVGNICDNSKSVTQNDLFVALVGTGLDSHDFIGDAVSQGARVVVVEREVELPPNVTVIRVASSRRAMAVLSQNFFDHPAKKLTTIAITGTCGKTSTSYIMRNVLEKSGKKVGLIGTIGCFIEGKHFKTSNTTPSAYEIHGFLDQMVEAGCSHCVMEVSSQGIKMDRVYGITFDYGLFTNLSVDHIGTNEHENYEEYRHYKSLFFTQCKQGFLNVDTRDHEYISSHATCDLITFGLENQGADLVGSDLVFSVGECDLSTGFTVNGNRNFTINMAGKFSAYNALSVVSVASALGISDEIISQGLLTSQVEGRAEIASHQYGYKIIIDYAHNYEEISNLIETISHYEYGTMMCIFGGGGNRPKARRYDFGKAIGKFADLTIITEDNPRFESFEEINEEIIRGLGESDGNYVVIQDRKEAIAHAVSTAKKGDIILLVGKGHESYQDIRGVKHHWSEKEAIFEVEQAYHK